MHIRFGLPAPLYFDSQSSIEMNSKAAASLRECNLIICDEALMVLRYAVETGDKKLKEIMDNNVIFGGKVVLFGGDFRQTLPIKARANHSEIIDLCIKNSYVWIHFEQRELMQNMQANPEKKQFVSDLL
ncbi:uncharacterized protein LOC142319922 [Lycorma delicatula]|uniref:uncharacterized protein LOC142319922 n=1 Tax=Lycorma delicatula TaxID=130591 RepID=UPI003F5184F4